MQTSGVIFVAPPTTDLSTRRTTTIFYDYEYFYDSLVKCTYQLYNWQTTACLGLWLIDSWRQKIHLILFQIRFYPPISSLQCQFCSCFPEIDFLTHWHLRWRFSLDFFLHPISEIQLHDSIFLLQVEMVNRCAYSWWKKKSMHFSSFFLFSFIYSCSFSFL